MVYCNKHLCACRKYATFFALLVSSLSGIAQDFQTSVKLPGDAVTRFNVSKAVTVGQNCPDILFKNVINYDKPEVRLSTFKGKYVLIDFWATWCGSCIRGFPKLEALTAKFSDKLQVILVANDYIDKVRDFYKMRPNMKLLTSIVDPKTERITDTENPNYYFPRLQIPHYVWIDAQGVVKAITGAEEIKEETIKAFVEGNPLHVSFKDGIKEVEGGSPMQVISNARIQSMKILDTTTIYERQLTVYNPYADARYRYARPEYKNRVIDVSNKTISQLYIAAYGGVHGEVEKFDDKQVIMEVKDPIKIDFPAYHKRDYTPAEFTDWQKKNQYNYKLILPKPDSGKLYQLMQEDLDNYFGYQVQFENRKMKCIVLKSIGALIIKAKSDYHVWNPSIYGVDMKNIDIILLVKGLEKYMSMLRADSTRPVPFFDETGIKDKIDISFNVNNMKNIDEVRTQLRKFNLDLIEEERMMKVLVIRDPASRSFSFR